MKKAFVLLAEGFEEGESLLTIDILRRSGITCDSVSILNKQVTGCNGISVNADYCIDEVDLNSYDMLILPGGMPGATNLVNCPYVIQSVQSFMSQNKYVAAICAAPMVLKDANVSKGRTLTSYPADKYRDLFIDSVYIENQIVVRDGNLITSRGPATVLEFAYALAEYSGVAEPGIPLNRAMQIPEARARVSTIENHMKRVAICTDCR